MFKRKIFIISSLTTSLLAVPMPANIKEKLEELWEQHIENVTVQPYVLDNEAPQLQREEPVGLTLEEIEKLGSPVIYADLEHTINAGQSLTTPLHLYFIDHTSLIIFKKIIHNAPLAGNEQHPQAIAHALMAADIYKFDINELIVATLRALNDNTLCMLYQYFSMEQMLSNHPNIARLIHQAIQQKEPFQYQQTNSIALEDSAHATDDSFGAITTNATGNRLVRGGTNIRIWDLVNGNWRPTKTLATEHYLVALSADGKHLVSAASNYATVWELQNGHWVIQEEILGEGEDLGDYSIKSIAINASGDRIFTGSEEQGILVWDLIDDIWELTARLEQADQPGDTENIIVALATNPVGDRVVSGCSNNTIQIWDFIDDEWQHTTTLGTDINDDSELEHSGGHTDEVNAIALSADGNRVVSGSRDQTIKIWDLITSEWQLTQTLDNYSGSRKETFDSGLWFINTTSLPLNYTGDNITGTPIALSADGNRIISRAKDASINIWHWVNDRFQLQQRIGPADFADSLAFSANGKRFFINAADNKSIIVWSEETLTDFCHRVAPELYEEAIIEEPAAKRTRTV